MACECEQCKCENGQNAPVTAADSTCIEDKEHLLIWSQTWRCLCNISIFIPDQQMKLKSVKSII